MIIEGIIATENENGEMHLAPIGPHVDEGLETWLLRPFQTSKTFANLHRTNRAVFHVIDDAFLMAASVLGLGNQITSLDSSFAVGNLAQEWRDKISASRKSHFDPLYGWILDHAHRYFALQVDTWDTSTPRASATCSMRFEKTMKPFWGWNRAKHAILELAILISRKHLLQAEYLKSELDRHRVIIEKTAGPQELDALALLSQAVSQ